MATAARTDDSPVIRTPDQRLRVFVSSTLEELSAERAALQGAIEDLHLTPVMFELGASPHPPRALYRAYLDQSHVFVGIYWQRYGWVAPDMEVSGLEDEYLLSDGMPRLIYFKEPADEREEQMAEFVGRIKAGESSFRKFRTTEELAELLREDLAHLLTERFESRADQPAGERPSSSLPVPVTRLVGREREVEEVQEMLHWEDVRLVTLSGVGGIGKSRLALEVASRQQGIRSDVYFADLTSVTDSELLGPAIAEAVGVSQRSDRPLRDAVIEHLRETDALLLLDNFEQIVEAGEFVTQILGACPGVKALVTSRTLLKVRGEHQWEVRPLATPVNGDRATLDLVAASPAVELFVERAQAADPRFVLNEANHDQIAELCVRLEGVPLALELSAAYIRLLPPAEMLERFGTHLDLEGNVDQPQRQRTLRATIDWSYGLLGEDEQRLLARLSVLEGGWNLTAAQAICQPDCAADVVQTLSHLVDNSLVAIADRPEGEPRFRMLETVREYAGERLSESGEREAVRRRHGEHYAELCTTARSHLHGEDRAKWMQRLDADYANIQALGPWALDGGDPELMLQAWGDIWVYIWMRARPHGVVKVMRSLEPMVPTLSVRAQAMHAWLLGACLYMLGEMAGAAEWLERCIPLMGEIGERRRHALAMTLLGGALPYESNRQKVESLLRSATELTRADDDSWGMSIALAQYAFVALREDRVDEAIELHREAIELARGMDNEFVLALALGQLAIDHLAKNDVESARAALAECAGICPRIESLEPAALCLEGLAGVAYGQQKATLSATLLGAAERAREGTAIPLWPLLEPLFARMVAGVRQETGEARFDALAAEGAAMSTEDALAMGLSGTA